MGIQPGSSGEMTELEAKTDTLRILQFSSPVPVSRGKMLQLLQLSCVPPPDSSLVGQQEQ